MLTAIVLSPAAVVAATGGGQAIRELTPIALAYLGFGALAGLVVGMARRHLARRSVAIGLGALIGGCGFSLLMLFGDTHNASRPMDTAVGALLGLSVGAMLGWRFWYRAADWGLR